MKVPMSVFLQHHLLQAQLLAQPAQADRFHEFGDLLRDRRRNGR
jgi:hypothetical protein